MSEFESPARVHILMLEDTDTDVDLIQHELRRSGLEFTVSRATDRGTFLSELTRQPPDIILSDYSLPQFNGLEALRLAKEEKCDIPFILVTGSQTEEVAVACMKEGAVDYILKSALTRLPSAVVNALKRSQAEQERTEALQALQQSQEQFLQSQKLEAVGRLAGGVAHDFNNLLTAIMGYSDLSLSNLSHEERLRRNLTEIKKASERAASLTRQLLAFSRKQVLQPRVFDLNVVVADMQRMLERMIGEDIQLRTNLEPNLGHVKADLGQIEQVIMNLVVNARDALPKGGKVTIETANVFLDEPYAQQHVAVTPGSYIMLGVSDTGVGMDEETQAHIFEPFFTTKETGKGTGLGLSTVYGIIKQSGGNIWVYSEVGRGSAFKIYLPRTNEDVDSKPQIMQGLARGTETILLVEDADIVRAMTKEILVSNGYNVLEADGGSQACVVAEQYKQTIHLLLTDVVMPEMGGYELAGHLQTIHPETKIIFMSGYTEDTIVNHGVLEEGTNFVQKPFTVSHLSKKVREVLDRD
jgi:two-component system, cell cycle sensor histidine kinase and response regulator CckA